MSKSPYLQQDLKEYLEFHKIETTISDVVNEILKNKFDDPYSYMMNQFGNMASNEAKIQSIKPFQVLNSDGKPTIKVSFQIIYKLQAIDILIDTQYCIASENSKVLFDNSEDGSQLETMNNAIQIIKKDCNTLISGKSSSDQKNIDEGLLAISNKHDGFLNITQTVSFGLASLNANIFYQPLYQYIRQLSGYIKSSDQKNNVPSIMVSLLQGSKVVGVKCKVYKFYLIVKEYQNPQEAFDIVKQITNNLKKTITSGKQGEAALKFHNDGTFICTVDTIADNLKQIEEAINKTSFRSQVGLGLSMMADNLYNQDKKLYELENPKQLLDLNQLIEFYSKLLKDKPIIEYLEDPVISDDSDSWAHLIKNLEDSGVKIGSRFLYKNTQQIQELTNPLNPQDYPDLSKEEIEQKNLYRVHLDAQVIKPYEFPTLSTFLNITKLLNSQKPKTCATIISDNITDTNDTSIVDFAFGINNCYLNIASPLKYEKLLKYNRFMEILELQNQN